MSSETQKYVAIKRFVVPKGTGRPKMTFQFIKATPEIEESHGSYDLPRGTSPQIKRANRSKYSPHAGAKQLAKSNED